MNSAGGPDSLLPVEPPAVDLGARPFLRRALGVLWPAFVMAGVLEMLVFVVVDPAELRWFGGARLDWSADAVYTVTFLIFWGVIATAGALSALLGADVDPAVEWPGRRVNNWPR